MTKILISVFLLLAGSPAFSQSTPTCTDYPAADKQLVTSAAFGDALAFSKVLQDIVVSGQPPAIQQKMTACALDWHSAAATGALQSPKVPDTFAPSIRQIPTPMVPSTSPQVLPMQNAAPNQLLQNGQTLMSAGQQMMMMGTLMDAEGAQAAHNASLSVAHAVSESESETDSPTKALRLAGKGEGFIVACSSLMQPSSIAPANGYSAIACGMFLEGIAQGMRKYPGAVKLLRHKKVANYLCVDPGTSPLQLVETVTDYIEQNPQAKDWPTGDVAAVALLHKFPCR